MVLSGSTFSQDSTAGPAVRMLFSAMKLTQKEGFKEKPSKSIPNKSIITVVCPILPFGECHKACPVLRFMFGFTTACPHPKHHEYVASCPHGNSQPTAPKQHHQLEPDHKNIQAGAVAFQNQMLGKPNIKPSCSVYIYIYKYIYIYIILYIYIYYIYIYILYIIYIYILYIIYIYYIYMPAVGYATHIL